jgi:S1-C subfamily serine protease
MSDLSDVIEIVRPAVVQITYTRLDLPPEESARIGAPFESRPIGTGFLVNRDGFAVTAKHVIDGAREQQASCRPGRHLVSAGVAYPITENFRGNFRAIPFDVVAEDAAHDLAVLQLRENPFEAGGPSLIAIGGEDALPLAPGILRLVTERPRDGLGVAASGYPLGEPVLVTTAGIVASSWAVDLEKLRAGLVDIRLADVYLADLQINPGNSGGPVYRRSDGAVVGVAVATRLAAMDAGEENLIIAPADIGVVVPAVHVAESLSARGIQWEGA